MKPFDLDQNREGSDLKANSATNRLHELYKYLIVSPGIKNQNRKQKYDVEQSTSYLRKVALFRRKKSVYIQNATIKSTKKQISLSRHSSNEDGLNLYLTL